MGLSPTALDRLVYLKERGHIGCLRRVVDIGAQNVYCAGNEERLQKFVTTFGGPALPDSTCREIAKSGASRQVWEHLKTEYAAVDTSGEFGALGLDLNFDPVPPEHRNRYDLVTNLGTTEHVANQLNAFQVIHDLTAPAGLMFHGLPFTGYTNHGLVNYTPKFFWQLQRGNQYEALDMYIFGEQVPQLPHPDITKMSDWRRRWRLISGDSIIFCLLRKTRDAAFVPPWDGYTGGMSEGAKNRYGIS